MSDSATKDELEAGRGYEALFVPALFGRWTRHLVEGAGLETGSHVLDVACGTGVLARHAFARTGRSGCVVGLDPARGMIATAREIEPDIVWILGVAEALPFDDVTFDSVVSQFGLMFFRDRQKAAREMLRVMRPGGRLAVAVWNSLENNSTYADLGVFLDEQIGTDAGDALRLPYCLGDAHELAAIFAQGGFGEVEVETRVEQAIFPSARTMLEAELRGWLPLFGIDLSDERISDVLLASDGRLSKYAAGTGKAVFQTSANIVTARKPQ